MCIYIYRGLWVCVYIYTYISERTALRVGPEPTYYRSLNNCLYYFFGGFLVRSNNSTMGSKTLFLIIDAPILQKPTIDPFKEPFKGNPILTIKTPTLL